MNDFTKKELQDMINWGEVYTEFGNSRTNYAHRPLIDKIKSMIDNYCEDEKVVNCEHAWVSVHTNPYLFGNKTYWKCMICGKNKDE